MKGLFGILKTSSLVTDHHKIYDSTKKALFKQDIDVVKLN